MQYHSHGELLPLGIEPRLEAERLQELPERLLLQHPGIHVEAREHVQEGLRGFGVWSSRERPLRGFQLALLPRLHPREFAEATADLPRSLAVRILPLQVGHLPSDPPRAFLDTVVQEGTKVPAFVWKAAFESRWRQEGDFSGELGKINAPTLSLWGDQDARYPRRQQEELASKIRGSRLLVYGGAGHFLHWEEPERLASDLRSFIEEPSA